MAAKVAADRRRLPLAVVLVIGAGLVVSGLSGISVAPVVLIAAGVAIGVPAFARLTPPGTVRSAMGLPTAILLRGFLTFAFFCADAYVPLVVQGWRHESAFLAGLALMAATLTWTAGSWVNARRIERLGPGRFLRVGFAVLVVGVLGFLAILAPAVPAWLAIPIWGVAGFGMGLSYSTPSLVVLREAVPHEQGAATASLQLSDVLGASLGTGIGGALVHLGTRAGEDVPGWEALAAIFGVSAAVAIAGLILTGRLGPRIAAGISPLQAEAMTA